MNTYYKVHLCTIKQLGIEEMVIWNKPCISMIVGVLSRSGNVDGCCKKDMRHPSFYWHWVGMRLVLDLKCIFHPLTVPFAQPGIDDWF